jgi:hypothetical protein
LFLHLIAMHAVAVKHLSSLISSDDALTNHASHWEQALSIATDPCHSNLPLPTHPYLLAHLLPAGAANSVANTANLESAGDKLQNKLGSTADAIKNINLFPDVRGDKPNTGKGCDGTHCPHTQCGWAKAQAVGSRWHVLA